MTDRQTQPETDTQINKQIEKTRGIMYLKPLVLIGNEFIIVLCRCYDFVLAFFIIMGWDGIISRCVVLLFCSLLYAGIGIFG